MTKIFFILTLLFSSINFAADLTPAAFAVQQGADSACVSERGSSDYVSVLMWKRTSTSGYNVQIKLNEKTITKVFDSVGSIGLHNIQYASSFDGTFFVSTNNRPYDVDVIGKRAFNLYQGQFVEGHTGRTIPVTCAVKL